MQTERASSVADLHLHTTYSDRELTPKDLIDLAVERGLKTIAVTDHNTTDGLTEAQAAAENHSDLEVIPRVELTTSTDGVHILGYFTDYAFPGSRLNWHASGSRSDVRSSNR